MTCCTTLSKPTRSETTRGSPGNPGSPGSPAVPTRTVTIPREVCEYIPSTSSTVVCEASTSLSAGRPEGIVCTLPGGITYTRQCHTEFTTETIPGRAAVPGVPASPATPDETVIEYNEGWNSHSRSRNPVLLGEQVTFKVLPGSRGVFVGLAPAGADALSPAAFAYGLRIDASGVTVVESGVDKRILAGIYFHNTEFTIARAANNRISYTVAGLTGHTSEVVPSPLPLYVYAMLYRGGDQITCAEIATTTIEGAPTGINQRYQFTARVSGQAWAVVNSRYSLHAVGTVSYANMVGTIDFTGIMSEAGYGDMAGDLGDFSCQINGGFAVPPSVISMDGGIDHFSVAMIGYTGSVGQMDVSIGTFSGLMWDYGGGGSMSGNIDTWLMYAESIGDDSVAQIFTSLEISSLLSGLRDLNAAFTATLELSSTASVAKSHVANIVSTLLLSSPNSAKADYIDYVLGELLLTNLWSVGQNDALPDNGSGNAVNHSVFAINLETGATTTYTNYGFSELYNGQGVAGDGVYNLGGSDTDNGNPIAAIVEMGAHQYDSHKKSVHNLYVAAKSNGNLLVKVEVDGVEWAYEARNAADDTSNKRFDFGRGLNGIYWKFTLLNQDGDDFEIASANFTPLIHTRRI